MNDRKLARKKFILKRLSERKIVGYIRNLFYVSMNVCNLFYFLFCKHIAVTRPFFWCHGFLKSIWRNKILKTKLNIRNKSSVSKFANYFKVYVSTQWCCEMYCYKAFHTCCPFHSCVYTVILWNDMLQSFLYVLSCPLVWVPALLFPEKKALVVTKYVRFISHWQHQTSCGLIHI